MTISVARPPAPAPKPAPRAPAPAPKPVAAAPKPAAAAAPKPGPKPAPAAAPKAATAPKPAAAPEYVTRAEFDEAFKAVVAGFDAMTAAINEVTEKLNGALAGFSPCASRGRWYSDDTRCCECG